MITGLSADFRAGPANACRRIKLGLAGPIADGGALALVQSSRHFRIVHAVKALFHYDSCLPTSGRQ